MVMSVFEFMPMCFMFVMMSVLYDDFSIRSCKATFSRFLHVKFVFVKPQSLHSVFKSVKRHAKVEHRPHEHIACNAGETIYE